MKPTIDNIDRLQEAISSLTDEERRLLEKVLGIRSPENKTLPHRTIMLRLPLFASLTRRERQVLDLIVEGNTNKEAARFLGISPRTVEVHRARAREKLGAPNLAAMVRMAVQVHAVDTGERASPTGQLR